MFASITLALVLSMSASAVQGPPPPSPRPPDRDAGPAPKGTAVVKGRVTSADTGRPLRRAQVQFSAPELPGGRTVPTDLLGEYEARELPAGFYTIAVKGSGHLPMTYGQRRFGEPGTPLEIADGQTLDKVNFAVARAGIITGQILDEAGEPASGVMVLAVQSQVFQGRRRLVPSTTAARTDDSGQYRILGVPPGEYVVQATLRETWVSDTDEKQTLAYLPSYFGGTADPAYALRVKVSVGQQVSPVDFSLIPGRAATISGTAFGSNGSPLAGSFVLLIDQVSGPGGRSVSVAGQVRVNPDGSWTLRDIGAGEYLLQVSRLDAGRAVESTSMPLVVHGADIDGVMLAAHSGALISGDVSVEDGGQLPASAVPLRVTTHLAIPRSGPPLPITPGEDDGVVRTDGGFLRRSASGPVIVRASPLPRGWAIKSIDIAGRDHADVPVDLRAGQRLEGVKIVITNRFPTVVGRMSDERGAPADGTVLLFPSDTAQWLESAGSVRTTRAEQSGMYRFESVRPGEYLLVALDSVQQWQVHDPEFLEQLREKASKVTLSQDGPATVNLTVKR